MFKRILNLTVIVCFFLTILGPLPKAQANTVLDLPQPGTMVNLSTAYEPVLIKGLTVHKDNPFLFDFIVDTGHSGVAGDALKMEGDRLVKYFFACLTIPEKDLWVNLSPYEKDRMVPRALGQTALGRDLLAQDYILKQLTASLIYPEKNLGKEFWDRVYTKARQMYGTTQIPVNTFNKVWIMADKATVYEHNQTAFVLDGHLKVMLEEDYLALQKHTLNSDVIPAKAGIQDRINFDVDPRLKHSGMTNSLGSQIVREIILPEIEKEVNTGKNFASLRQIFNSLILATWYKKNLKEALLNQVYADKSTVKGVNLADPSVKEQIYQQYLQAYKKGVFNYIKEDPQSDGQTIPRKYFSGGFGSQVAEHLDIAYAMTALQESRITGSNNYAMQVVLNVNGVNQAQHPSSAAMATGNLPDTNGVILPSSAEKFIRRVLDLLQQGKIPDTGVRQMLISSIQALEWGKVLDGNMDAFVSARNPVLDKLELAASRAMTVIGQLDFHTDPLLSENIIFSVHGYNLPLKEISKIDIWQGEKRGWVEKYSTKVISIQGALSVLKAIKLGSTVRVTLEPLANLMAITLGPESYPFNRIVPILNTSFHNGESLGRVLSFAIGGSPNIGLKIITAYKPTIVKKLSGSNVINATLINLDRNGYIKNSEAMDKESILREIQRTKSSAWLVKMDIGRRGYLLLLVYGHEPVIFKSAAMAVASDDIFNRAMTVAEAVVKISVTVAELQKSPIKTFHVYWGKELIYSSSVNGFSPLGLWQTLEAKIGKYAHVDYQFVRDAFYLTRPATTVSYFSTRLGGIYLNNEMMTVPQQVVDEVARLKSEIEAYRQKIEGLIRAHQFSLVVKQRFFEGILINQLDDLLIKLIKDNRLADAELDSERIVDKYGSIGLRNYSNGRSWDQIRNSNLKPQRGDMIIWHNKSFIVYGNGLSQDVRPNPHAQVHIFTFENRRILDIGAAMTAYAEAYAYLTEDVVSKVLLDELINQFHAQRIEVGGLLDLLSQQEQGIIGLRVQDRLLGSAILRDGKIALQYQLPSEKWLSLVVSKEECVILLAILAKKSDAGFVDARNLIKLLKSHLQSATTAVLTAGSHQLPIVKTIADAFVKKNEIVGRMKLLGRSLNKWGINRFRPELSITDKEMIIRQIKSQRILTAASRYSKQKGSPQEVKVNQVLDDLAGDSSRLSYLEILVYFPDNTSEKYAVLETGNNVTVFKIDAAMRTRQAALIRVPQAIAGITNWTRGGIDLNAANMGMTVTKDANGGVKVTFDPAMLARIKAQGIQSADPVIIRVTPLSPAEISPLLGFKV